MGLVMRMLGAELQGQKRCDLLLAPAAQGHFIGPRTGVKRLQKRQIGVTNWSKFKDLFWHG